MKIISFIYKRTVMQKILTHLNIYKVTPCYESKLQNLTHTTLLFSVINSPVRNVSMQAAGPRVGPSYRLVGGSFDSTHKIVFGFIGATPQPAEKVKS
jgi:hypothetical protein